MTESTPGFRALEKGTRLQAIERAFDDPRDVLRGIGALLVKETKKAFREQRLGSVRWKTRGETGMVPNWPGLLEDFGPRGKTNPPDRRFEPAPVLKDWGDLARSFAQDPVLIGDDTVEHGSALPYADVLHAGGESETAEITAALQERMWDWMQRARNASKRAGDRVASAVGQEKRDKAQASFSKKRRIAEQTSKLGWLLNRGLRGQSLTVRHPPRPMVGMPDSLVEEIEEIYGKRVVRG
jgi:hypothetical protein